MKHRVLTTRDALVVLGVGFYGAPSVIIFTWFTIRGDDPPWLMLSIGLGACALCVWIALLHERVNPNGK
jgi:flavin reductase (DIM6/NTAB) family NADH-FMN oxidoreductase RutF